MTTPIRAVIIDSDRCEVDGYSTTGYAPVLSMCRQLMEAGYDRRRPLHAYRDGVPVLRIRSIGEGAMLTVEDAKNGRPRFRRQRGPQGVGEARPCAERLAA